MSRFSRFFSAATKSISDLHPLLLRGDVENVNAILRTNPSLARASGSDILPPVIAAVHHSFIHTNGGRVLMTLKRYGADFNATHFVENFRGVKIDMLLSPLAWLILQGGDRRLTDVLINNGTDEHHPSVEAVIRLVQRHQKHGAFCHNRHFYHQHDASSVTLAASLLPTYTPFSIELAIGQPDKVEKLLSTKPSLARACSPHIMPPVTTAIRESWFQPGRSHVLDILHGHGADFNEEYMVSNHHGVGVFRRLTPLAFLLLNGGDEQCMGTLVANGADPEHPSIKHVLDLITLHHYNNPSSYIDRFPHPFSANPVKLAERFASDYGSSSLRMGAK